MTLNKKQKIFLYGKNANFYQTEKFTKKKKIFLYLKKLPKGKITTYKFLAEKFHTSPRVVGQMLKSNKDKSVPCYKVIPYQTEKLIKRMLKEQREVRVYTSLIHKKASVGSSRGLVGWRGKLPNKNLGGYNNLLGKSKKELLKKEGIILPQHPF